MTFTKHTSIEEGEYNIFIKPFLSTTKGNEIRFNEFILKAAQILCKLCKQEGLPRDGDSLLLLHKKILNNENKTNDLSDKVVVEKIGGKSVITIPKDMLVEVVKSLVAEELEKRTVVLEEKEELKELDIIEEDKKNNIKITIEKILASNRNTSSRKIIVLLKEYSDGLFQKQIYTKLNISASNVQGAINFLCGKGIVEVSKKKDNDRSNNFVKLIQGE